MPPAPAEPPDAGRDIRRPLDESVPVEPREEPAVRHAVPEPEATVPPVEGVGAEPALRPAVPIEPGQTAAAQTGEAEPEPVDTGETGAERPETSQPEPDTAPGVPGEATDAMPGASEEAGADTAPGVPEETADATPAWRRRAVGLARTARRLAGPPVQLAKAAGQWSRRPGGRYALNAALLATLLAAAVSVGAFVVPTAGVPDPDEPTDPATATPSFPPSGPPVVAPPIGSPGNPAGTPGASSPPGVPGEPSQALAGWASEMAARTAIPEVALRAYGYAELAVAATTPGCQLSWTTLAAIGRVESNHGSTGGATLLPDGQVLPPVLGPPLDGQGDVAQINDTDQGALDGDPVYDRAVGPMQFIPSTWQIEQVDATNDGLADVNNIHDAALAAANYLCRGARNLAIAADWWQAVLSYNDVQVYANDVFRYANEYGLRSRGG